MEQSHGLKVLKGDKDSRSAYGMLIKRIIRKRNIKTKNWRQNDKTGVGLFEDKITGGQSAE